MKKIGVFYGSDTGCTEAVMEKLKEIIGDIAEFIDVSQVKNKEELLEIENLDYHTKHVDHIFQKVFET